MTRHIEGRYRDALIGFQGCVQWDSGWRPNLIVQPCNVLLAALMKGQPDMRGILFWAVGKGEASWDADPPSPAVTTSELAKEVFRAPLSEENIIFLDDAYQPTYPPATPSHRLEIAADFKGADLVSDGSQPLREFGLFGGNATEAPDSGLMIDYVVHPRIDLKPDDVLSRTLCLTFGASGVAEEVVLGFGADLLVSSLDGVGESYKGIFLKEGIDTLGILVEVIDPLQPVVKGIPPAKLREFRTKARLVLDLRLSPAWLAPFEDLSVSQFLKTPPQDLSAPDVTPDMVGRLQETLAVLQVALDEEKLQDIKLGDLTKV